VRNACPKPHVVDSPHFPPRVRCYHPSVLSRQSPWRSQFLRRRDFFTNTTVAMHSDSFYIDDTSICGNISARTRLRVNGITMACANRLLITPAGSKRPGITGKFRGGIGNRQARVNLTEICGTSDCGAKRCRASVFCFYGIIREQTFVVPLFS
jgi:hypothetical protein